MEVKTLNIKPENVESKWYLVNAENQVLGRLSTQVATILRGKHHPEYSPHWDFGDHVIVVNAAKVKLTGKKEQQKKYFRHTGFPGGEKFTPYLKLLADKPESIIEHAVKGMLPKNRLGRKLFKKLKVYAGDQHPHQAQQPVELEL